MSFTRVPRPNGVVPKELHERLVQQSKLLDPQYMMKSIMPLLQMVAGVCERDSILDRLYRLDVLSPQRVYAIARNIMNEDDDDYTNGGLAAEWNLMRAINRALNNPVTKGTPGLGDISLKFRAEIKALNEAILGTNKRLEHLVNTLAPRGSSPSAAPNTPSPQATTASALATHDAQTAKVKLTALEAKLKASEDITRIAKAQLYNHRITISQMQKADAELRSANMKLASQLTRKVDLLEMDLERYWEELGLMRRERESSAMGTTGEEILTSVDRNARTNAAQVQAWLAEVKHRANGIERVFVESPANNAVDPAEAAEREAVDKDEVEVEAEHHEAEDDEAETETPSEWIEVWGRPCNTLDRQTMTGF